MKKEILEILEKDSRLSPKEISVMIGANEDEVVKAIKEMEENQIICGYTTLINWDNTEKEDEFVTAMIEVRVTPQRDQGFDKIAKRIYKFEEVKAVYLMSGAYDLTVILEGKNIKDISNFVTNKLSTLDTVLSTATHFVLKKYKDHGTILCGDRKVDERMIITP